VCWSSCTRSRRVADTRAWHGDPGAFLAAAMPSEQAGPLWPEGLTIEQGGTICGF
jgi:hypothetical protein